MAEWIASPGKMASTLTWRQLCAWEWYYHEHDKERDRKLYYTTGLICSTLVQCMTDSTRTPEDFMPEYLRPKVQPMGPEGWAFFKAQIKARAGPIQPTDTEKET